MCCEQVKGFTIGPTQAKKKLRLVTELHCLNCAKPTEKS